MSTQKGGPARGNTGGWGNCGGGVADGRSFPRFQPVPDNRKLPQKTEPCCKEAKQCCRSHSLQQTLSNGQSEVRQIHCSAHPNVSGCCSARPPLLPVRRRLAEGRRTGYRPPLGTRCGRSVPVVSLTSIYRELEFTCDDGAEEEEGKLMLDESGTELTASHSCPLSSASPEPRPCCCRRQSGPPGHPQHLEVLLQRSSPPENTNHSAAKVAKNNSHWKASQTLLEATAASSTSMMRSRSATQPTSSNQAAGRHRVTQSPRAKPQQLRQQRQPSQPPLLQQRRQQQNQHHRQLEAIICSQSFSPPPRSCFGKNYSIYNNSNTEESASTQFWSVPDRPPPLHQHILRRPLTSLLRSPSCLEQSRRGGDCSASD